MSSQAPSHPTPQPRLGVPGPRDRAELPTSCATPASPVCLPGPRFPYLESGQSPAPGLYWVRHQGKEKRAKCRVQEGRAGEAGQAGAWRAWKAWLCSVDWTLQARPWQALPLTSPWPEPEHPRGPGPKPYLGRPRSINFSFNLRNCVKLHPADEIGDAT